MTDLLAILGGATGLTGLVTVIVFALRLSSAQGRERDAAVALENARGQLALSASALADRTNAYDAERDRAARLLKEIQDADATADPATARERVLARWTAEARDTAPGAPSAVPVDGARRAAGGRSAGAASRAPVAGSSSRARRRGA